MFIRGAYDDDVGAADFVAAAEHLVRGVNPAPRNAGSNLSVVTGIK
jgi:hypothetical protein